MILTKVTQHLKLIVFVLAMFLVVITSNKIYAQTSLQTTNAPLVSHHMGQTVEGPYEYIYIIKRKEL